MHLELKETPMVAAWFTVACLQALRDEINALAPARAKGADGTIGDTAHASGGTSDHLPDDDPAFPALHGKDADTRNEVHALDITTELNEPGLTLEAIVQHILARCRSGSERRLRYIIFNRRIWEASNGWVQRTYTGTADPHTGHAHFSASYESAREADASSWHLEEIPVALTDADKKWQEAMTTRVVDARADAMEANILAKLTGVPAAVWASKFNVNVAKGQAVSLQQAGDILRYLSPEGKQGRDLTTAVGKDVTALRIDLAKIAGDVAELAAKPAQPAAGA